MSHAKIAVIHEATCIGCTKCLQVCPVDAIIGASKQMHSILSADCIGCGWCLPPCPVNCIEMVEAKPLVSSADRLKQAQNIKKRVKRRKERLARQAAQKALADKQVTAGNIKDIIAAAIARSQQKQTKWNSADE